MEGLRGNEGIIRKVRGWGVEYISDSLSIKVYVQFIMKYTPACSLGLVVIVQSDAQRENTFHTLR